MSSRIRLSIIVTAAAGALALVATQRTRIIGAVKALVGRFTGGSSEQQDSADGVESTSQDSFPASDPPSYGPGL